MKVALYARVSSDRQDVDLSISAQLKALREYALRNSYQAVREFVGEAETGKHDGVMAKGDHVLQDGDVIELHM